MTEMYSTYNEGNSVLAEIIITTVKSMISKHMAAMSRNVYFDVLDNIFDKYNSTYNNTIKIRSADVKSLILILGSHARIWMYKLLPKDMLLSGLKKFF